MMQFIMLRERTLTQHISIAMDALARLNLLYLLAINGALIRCDGRNLVSMEKITNINRQTKLLKFPEGLILNEAWGCMSASRYEWLKRNPPAWWRYVICIVFLAPHPYAKYASTDKLYSDIN
jgi:hypothetical protein